MHKDTYTSLFQLTCAACTLCFCLPATCSFSSSCELHPAWKWPAESRCRSRLGWVCPDHQHHTWHIQPATRCSLKNHNQFMLLFKHMPYDEFHKAAIKNIAYTVVRQAARPVQATTASQTVNQVIPKVIFPLKISAIKLRLLPWATIICYQAIRSSLCYSEWEMGLARTTRKNCHSRYSLRVQKHTQKEQKAKEREAVIGREAAL